MLIEKEYGFEQRKAYAKEPLGYSQARWAQFAELGLLALPFTEAQGGPGLVVLGGLEGPEVSGVVGALGDLQRPEREIVGGAVEELTLLGQDQAARMPVEERD